jgi:hypothetical protein
LEATREFLAIDNNMRNFIWLDAFSGSMGELGDMNICEDGVHPADNERVA